MPLLSHLACPLVCCVACPLLAMFGAVLYAKLDLLALLHSLTAQDLVNEMMDLDMGLAKKELESSQ